MFGRCDFRSNYNKISNLTLFVNQVVGTDFISKTN